MSRLSILFFSACLCLAWGWEPGTQYVYDYTGRAISGIYYLKQQNAVIEIRSRVTVQSQDENTLVVKLSDARIKRNGKFEHNPFINGDDNENEMNPIYREQIGGQEDPIGNPEQFGAPFVITHNKGSVTGIKVGAEEPLWVVNYKKSIATHLQLDITGVRPDSEPVNWQAVKDEEKSATFSVFEDTVTGDCSTTIAVHRMPLSKLYEHDAYRQNPQVYETACQGKPVYDIIKTKDFNRCQTNPVAYSAQPASYLCSLDKAYCSEFLQRKATYRYIACGDFPRLTYLSVVTWSDLVVKPFAIDTQELTSSNALRWQLEKKEGITSRLSAPSNSKEYKSLSFILPEFEQDQDPTDTTFVQPTLEEAYLKSPIAIQKLQQIIYETLRYVVKDLKEQPDSQSDNLERLAVIARALQMFPLEELRGFWEQVKREDPLLINLFVDTIAQAGTNPAVMLIKEIIQSKEIGETKAIYTIASLGYHVKTPTPELLRELVELYKSSPVQSSKTLKQTTLVTLADLLHATCGDLISAKRFPQQLGNICDMKDPVVVNEFLPQLVKELKSSNTPAERIVVLTALGSLGTEEIIPILLPYIRGSGDFNDTAERTRAVLSLHKVVYAVPEKVHPILSALASNTEERPEVRMAAISLLFTSNAPFHLWQHFATATWYERSQQMVSFTSSLIKSLTELEPITPKHEEIIEKANQAWTLTRRAPTGLPYSFFDIKSTSLDDLAAIVLSQKYRVAGEGLPGFFAKQQVYQFGPIIAKPWTVLLWNYNMGDIWQNVYNKIFGGFDSDSSSSIRIRGRESGNIVRNVWDELKVSGRPTDKPVSLLHVNLMGSINRFVDIENLIQNIPNMMSQAQMYQSRPYEVNMTKYGMLAEYNIKFPSEMGLPMRFLANLPVLVSVQGAIKSNPQGGIKSDVSAEFSWKLSSELRVELPFNGNYAATGVDVRAEIRTPKELTWNLVDGTAKVAWTPGSKVTDLFYYHVKPYTVTRNVVDSFKPTLEDEKATHIISVNEQPIKRDVSLGERFGLNIQLISKSEQDFTDFASWIQYYKKWMVAGAPKLSLVPLDLKYRELIVRYKPEGTKARTVQTWFQYQYATKSCKHSVVFKSGEQQPQSSAPEIVSTRPIAPEFKPSFERILKDIESGNVRLIRSGFTAEQKDGTFIHFNATLGLSRDIWRTKDFTDLHVEKYTTTGPSVNANKKVDYALCYWAVRNWNNPPKYGFSKDVLYLTDDETISFGEHCDQNKIRFKAKVYRDEVAAKHALYSPVGQQCQKDMSAGFMYGSPACEQARILDQTYNNYELSAEVEKELPEPINRWANAVRNYVNHALYRFTVEHTYTNNAANRASWTIKYNPYTEASNMTFVRPSETVVAHNVRISDEYKEQKPVTTAAFQTMYPLNAGIHIFNVAANLTSGGAYEDKCFVGPKAVYTYDGGFYNYTVDQCEHILLTDCSQKTELAVSARQEGQYKVVKVSYKNDIIELDPSGYVTINGQKSNYKGQDKDTHYEIRDVNNKDIVVVVYPHQDALILEIRPIHFYVKVLGSQVELTAPHLMRGQPCGLCGDYNQETYGEFKTPDRCTLSAGELMAASFKLTTGQSCSGKKDDSISRRLAKETQKCTPIDEHYQTHLPEVELNKPTKCTRYEKLTYEGTYSKGSCQSVQYSAKCQPGCKPHMLVSKQFTFKCSGAGWKDFNTVMTVPSSCITDA